ncbi:MAG: hypothetical protein DHS20C20_06260 [Ardenticatenaceae bacterium]|nr:MAG: hypothetical protein DHS20C20_06260 [Ardenticatenaceae bacterium]
MRKIRKIIVLSSGIFILSVLAAQIFLPNLWAFYFPFLRERTSSDVAQDFAKALRLNEQEAYELADPQLWPRIDQWMETHRVRDCIRVPDEQFTGGGGSNGNHTVLFYCFLENGLRYEFDVYDIQIVKIEESFRVIDWGEVKEGAAG